MKTKREVSAKAVLDDRREHPVRKPLSERERNAKRELSARPFPTLNERERSEREFSGGNLPVGAGAAKAVPDKRREHPVGADTVRSVPDAA